MREMIDSQQDGFALGAYRAKAKGERLGGVVVVQEIFGVTDHIREMCDLFARAGYDAVAPSFFDRIEPDFHAETNPDGFAKGLAAVKATSWDQAAADVQSALDTIEGPRFVTGFCWGGTVAWLAASRCAGLNAAASFYGRLIIDLLDERPRVPIMLHYGANDASIPEANRARVQAVVPDAPLYLYAAGHGFCRRGGHDFDPAACELALERTLQWFKAWRG